jgi:glycosyltransferase involved in cell wall biosynthesis
MKNKLSAVIIAKNAGNTIKESIDSLKWCDEVVVIDDKSTDDTIEVSKKHGARVYKRSMNNDFAAQRNYAYEIVKSDWIFFVDDDELVTPELKEEICLIFSKKISKKIAIFYMRRNDYFLGNLLKHGPAGTAFFARLLRKERTSWSGKIFEQVITSGESVYLQQRLIHNRQEDVHNLIVKANYYSDLEAEMLYEQGIKTNGWKIMTDPILRFNQYYWGKKAFLDGVPGFVFVLLGSVLVKFLADVKLWYRYNQEV